MKPIEWYKNTYGGEDIVFNEDGTLSVAKWLIMLIRAKTGLRSKKSRVIRKVIKKEITKAIKEGLNATKRL